MVIYDFIPKEYFLIIANCIFRKRKSYKVADLMSSSNSCPRQPPIANLRDFLVTLLSDAKGMEERFSARDVNDAIGVFAVNGVKVRLICTVWLKSQTTIGCVKC